MASPVLLKTCFTVWRGSLTGPVMSCKSVIDPRPLNPGTLHSSSLLPSPAPTQSNSPKTWARDQDSVPRKGQRIPRDGPFGRSQPRKSLLPNHSPAVLPCLPPTPVLKPEVGREGPGWFASSPIVFQTMGKVPLSQAWDSLLQRPKLGQGGMGREAVGERSCQHGQMARETLHRLRSVGEEGSKAKVSWVQSVPTTQAGHRPQHSAGVQVAAHLSTGACSRPSTTHSRRDVKPWLHTGHSRAGSGRDRTSARALYKYPA